MPFTDFLAMLCAPDDWTSFQAWKHAFLRDNPDFKFQLQNRSVSIQEAPEYWLLNHFKSDRSLNDYWQTPLGQLNRWIVLFWVQVKRPELRILLWQVSWKWRMRGGR
ncbi:MULTISPECIES: hypothetical protein [Trichocoleus]|uniref:Reverse transcriptase zinc-binding domain-containing protein n=1 Tax=Trichocoleus desertorum GB2-A4 TaxID=2933944 RepID=A0ABV0JCT2_9CYAN|nr:hypothetical protein [Trichocoleus sp. FACHB-46]MBD1864242.1 hypothetical protein [Trichocoleus sp. FACHB-46]